ncbi:MAG: HlyD family efflux transporter periplasmic adaptor subunit, partial [Spirochaetaceae bacterium]|nr:HlyD family efflux transporter periplasmic adaptor subunit [Spirochaetaceae bacterium]
MTRKTKIILFSILVPVLIIAVIPVYFLLNRTAEAAAVSEVGPALIVEVKVQTKRDGIEISGNIEPASSADLAFPIAGYIDAVFVSEGDVVRAGEVVAILEDSQQRYNLAEVDVEIDAENIAGTRRNLDLLDLKRDMTATELEDTRLSSTIAGVVSGVYLDVGDFVTDQKSGDDKDIVVRIIDRSSMTATVEVDELDAPYLSHGQSVEFQFDAYPDIAVSGVVSKIPLEARVTSQGIAV